MSAKEYKLAEKVGPGGVKCPCCVKGTLTDHKRRNNRKFRRKTRRQEKEAITHEGT